VDLVIKTLRSLYVDNIGTDIHQLQAFFISTKHVVSDLYVVIFGGADGASRAALRRVKLFLLFLDYIFIFLVQ